MSAEMPPSPPQENTTADEAVKPSRGTTSTTATLKALFSCHVQNGQPNPVHVTIASRGYDFQSRVLRIPDRFGWFTRGPPRRSAYEGYTFVYICVFLGVEAILLSICLIAVDSIGQPIMTLSIALLVFYVMVLALIWAVIIHSPQRKPDYYWGDNPEVLVV
ncbi:hypothetical protein GGI35DRAFT_430809 [Trichoderma velutinum]